MEESNPPDLRARVVCEQVKAHYSQLPVMTLAPCAGGLFAAAVLWNAAPQQVLVIGIAAVWLLAGLRLWLYRLYLAASERDKQSRWRWMAVAGALASGCLWGSAAPLLYPVVAGDHAVFLLVLLTLLPVVPVAALAVYLPALFAYFLPCTVPFLLMLALADTQAERMSAVLLMAMMGAMITFARQYAASLAEAITLDLKLADKAMALETAMRQKSRLIAAASHDLRQPVHAMGLFVELLRRAGDSPGRSDGLDGLASALQSLRAMLDDLLQVSKLDAQVVQPAPQHFLAAPLLERLHAEYAPQAAAQGLRLRLRQLSADTVVVSDPMLLERMLRNLLSNALKFTRQGGVALLCRHRGAMVWLQVCDTGTGIKPEHQQAVFDEFTQVDNRQRDDSKGLGLGLAIVKRLATLQQHRVLLVSNWGRGSTFTIELPRGSAGLAGRTAGPSEVPAPSPAKHRLPPGRLVLVVDDDLAVRTATAALFAHWGLRSCVAASAAEAMALVATEAQPPALAVVDLQWGADDSGLDLIAALRQHCARPDLPAILITGDMAPEHVARTHRLDIVLLRKPVDPAQLELAATAAMCQ